jgi:hypothetical protein
VNRRWTVQRDTPFFEKDRVLPVGKLLVQLINGEAGGVQKEPMQEPIDLDHVIPFEVEPLPMLDPFVKEKSMDQCLELIGDHAIDDKDLA